MVRLAWLDQALAGGRGTRPHADAGAGNALHELIYAMRRAEGPGTAPLEPGGAGSPRIRELHTAGGGRSRRERRDNAAFHLRFATLLVSALASALFITPTTYYRITFGHHDLIEFSSRVAITGPLALALAVCGAIPPAGRCPLRRRRTPHRRVGRLGAPPRLGGRRRDRRADRGERPAMTPPAALLDLDGTLVDSNYQHALAWYRAFRLHGITIPVWRCHRAIGMGGDQIISFLAVRALSVSTVGLQGRQSREGQDDRRAHRWLRRR